METFQKAIDLVRTAVEEERIPSAALAIGDRDHLYVKKTFGYTSLTEDRTPIDNHTLYDMASVSKVMATTMVTLRFIADGKMDLADMLPVYFGNMVPEDKKEITLFQLLTHTSGFPDHIWLEHYVEAGGDPVDFLLHFPLAYKPGTQVIYSCMGFILLGKILERISGQPLNQLAHDLVFAPLGMNHTSYHPVNQPVDQSNTAFTERNHLTGEWLCGLVHDENAYFLNGISGNAGVFSDIDDCILFARMLAGHGTLDGVEIVPSRIFDQAIRNYTPGMGENRGLGFHLANGHFSYSGQFFDQEAFGHTGFTGPHMLVSPNTGLYVVMLNNRVHPNREKDSGNLRLRRLLHTQAAIDYEKLMKKQI